MTIEFDPKLFEEVLDDLKPAHRMILVGYYGLRGTKQMTLAKMGIRYFSGVSASRIHQMKRKAIEDAVRLLKQRHLI